MIKKIISYFSNKIQHKMLLSYILLIIPTVLLLLIFFNNAQEDYNKQILYQTNLTSMQLSKQFKEQFARYNDYFNIIMYDISLNNYITNQNSNVEVNKINRFLNQFKYFTVGIKRLEIYVDEKYNIKSISSLKPIKDIKNVSWYDDVISNDDAIVLKYDDNIIIAQQYPDILSHDSVIAAYISYDILFYSIDKDNNIKSDVIIYDKLNDTVVYTKDNSGKENISDYLKLSRNIMNDDGDGNIEFDDNKYLYSNNKIISTQWYVICVSDLSENDLMLENLAFTIIPLIIISALFIIAFLWYIRALLVNPILQVSKKIAKVASGDFNARLEVISHDELGQLSKDFNQMVEKISVLTSKVEIDELKLKEMELKALRAQVNPHFLYNCLSAINMEALKVDNDKISDLVTSLATFYRTALNKGEDKTIITEEILNTKAYLDIQLFMRDYDFDVIYDIDDVVYEKPYKILKLLLQPIVENCIEHGINNVDYRGVIKIDIHILKDIVEITISDNGKGMNVIDIFNATHENYSGYGILSVNERIHLNYGTDYGINYLQNEHNGVSAVITLPIILTD